MRALVVLLFITQAQFAWSWLFQARSSAPPPRVERVASGEPEHLVDCINSVNDGNRKGTGTTWEGAMADVPCMLVAAGAWWSDKPASSPLTIVTQLSANRISQLWAQCKSWPGPLSAAVHVAMSQPVPWPLSRANALMLQRTIAAIGDLHRMIERDAGACRLDLLLVYEVYTEGRAMILYPVNALRNLARLQARTDLIGLMDVDMLVSSTLAESLMKQEEAERMQRACRQQRIVYVMPAFETNDDDTLKADKLVRQSKASLIRSIGRGKIAPFASKRFPEGHNVTSFVRWYRESEQYSVTYVERFEPWVIADRRAIPWHDERFRGYGQNKITHVAHTNASGFKFVVHPTGFILHRSHGVTDARKTFQADIQLNKQRRSEHNNGLATNSLYSHSYRLWKEAKSLMDVGQYKPALGDATRLCASRLLWWKELLTFEFPP